MGASGASASTNWKVLYEAAVLELDTKKALDRINEAKSAVTARLQHVNMSKNSGEAEQLINALNALQDLRKIFEGER